MKSVSVRSGLLALTLSVLLPGILAALWLIVQTCSAEQEAVQRNLRATTRALSMVVDEAVAQRAAIARVLAQSLLLDEVPALSADQLQAFAEQARAAMDGLQGWVELASPTATLLSTRQSRGSEAAEGKTAQRLPLVEHALISRLEIGAGGALRSAAVFPVKRAGRTVLNLSVTLLPAELQHLIDQQDLPPQWQAIIIDAGGTVVARHTGGTADVGNPSLPALPARTAGQTQGAFEWEAPVGQRMAAYFSISPTGWTFVTAMPRAQMTQPLRQAVQHVLLGSLLLLALAVGGAFLVSRSIVRPLQRLGQAADSWQAGEAVESRSTGIIECDELALALAGAAEQVHAARGSLEQQVSDAVERTRQIEQRAAQSQRVEALGRVAAGVAHDFNNLLGVIGNNAHLIELLATTPELKAPAAATLRAVALGAQLTQHLLRLIGRQAMLPRTLDLADHLPALSALLQMVLGRRIKLSIDVAAATPSVFIDIGELDLALVNLALNAGEAIAGNGHVAITAGPADAAEVPGLPDHAAHGQVLITFSDDGAGIAEDLIDKVFEPFFTTKPLGQGSGLGLSQLQVFCSQAGGHVWLTSTAGVGTQVFLLLPAAGPERSPAPSRTRTDRRLDGTRVLLVDDNEALAASTMALLRTYGCEVMLATCSTDALSLINGQARVDVVLSDIIVPGEMDGVGLARVLREASPALPVVLASGYDASLSASDQFVLLRKPYTSGALFAALQKALQGDGDPSQPVQAKA